jgi:MoaA/NifB/PqqE/SkfB family radical SAM enzyme
MRFGCIQNWYKSCNQGKKQQSSEAVLMLKRKFLLNVELTPNCPANCSMCPRSDVLENGYLSLDKATEIAQLCSESDIWEISLAGRGEPTLNSKLMEITKIFNSTKIPISLVTTTLNLKNSEIDALAENISIFRLSVSSIDTQIFSKIHTGLNYNRIWKNLKDLAPAIAEKTVIHLTGGPLIYESLDETVSTLRSYGYKKFYIFPLWNRSGSIKESRNKENRIYFIKKLGLKLSEDEYFNIKNRAKQIGYIGYNKIVNHRFCAVGDSSLSVAFDGKILGCFQDFAHRSIIGSVSNQSLEKIFRERKKILGKMPICINCNSNKESIFI